MSISKKPVQYLFPHVFSADLAVDCAKNPCHTTYVRGSFLVTDKIMLENPHTISMRTGSKIFPEL